MSMLGYQRRDVYSALQKWWVGEGALSEVEDLLGAKRPFLHQFFFQSNILDVRGFKEEGVAFQDAFNILILHLVMLALRIKKVEPSRKR